MEEGGSVKQDAGPFERMLEFRPAYDRTKEGYGIHCMEMCFVLKGEHGAVQFLLMTGWYLKHLRGKSGLDKPLPADLGYHSFVPQYEDQSPMSGECNILGAQCYYDGSTVAAEPVFEALLEKGEEGVWAILEERYVELFGSPEGEVSDVVSEETP